METIETAASVPSTSFYQETWQTRIHRITRPKIHVHNSIMDKSTPPVWLYVTERRKPALWAGVGWFYTHTHSPMKPRMHGVQVQASMGCSQLQSQVNQREGGGDPHSISFQQAREYAWFCQLTRDSWIAPHLWVGTRAVPMAHALAQ